MCQVFVFVNFRIFVRVSTYLLSIGYYHYALIYLHCVFYLCLHIYYFLQCLKNEATPELPYRFQETSDSCIRRHYRPTKLQEQNGFQSQSPVSVLENGAGKSLLISSHINKRTRSKRARPSVNPWLLLLPVFSATKNRETRKKFSQVERAKKTFPYFAEPRNAAPQRPAVAKKCAHCEVTKTPQWREGPMGPKTLCNACGVRFRSGRLYPEYRPAASPTFVPSVHSNSHKKVVEMRTKAKQHKVIDVEDSSIFGDLEFVPVSGYL